MDKKRSVGMDDHIESFMSAFDPTVSTVPVASNHCVGAYLFPGWETRRQWQPISVHPHLGTYDQSKPAVVEWQIKWAEEKGMELRTPSIAFSLDNAVMVAVRAFYLLQKLPQ